MDSDKPLAETIAQAGFEYSRRNTSKGATDKPTNNCISTCPYLAEMCRTEERMREEIDRLMKEVQKMEVMDKEMAKNLKRWAADYELNCSLAWSRGVAAERERCMRKVEVLWAEETRLIINDVNPGHNSAGNVVVLTIDEYNALCGCCSAVLEAIRKGE